MDKPSEKIKEKLDLVDFIKNYIELRPAGRNFRGLCPFHGERTPSFIVSKDRQIWHCFGCGLGGDLFKFLMQYENLEFREALKVLAEKAGVELRGVSPEEYRLFGVLYDINNAAKDFYLENAKKFPVGTEYLKSRGLNPETIEEFEIGFAPNAFDGATTHLLKLGFKVDDIIRAGIAFRSDSGRVGDRFKGRIMFPIHDHSGKVAGFSGRILPELENTDTGKYVNSPETPIYNKSKLMYGFWKTKKSIRDSRAALLVEGQMDFLMTYQSGVKNIVAVSGTALTPEHLKTLKPIIDTALVSFDNDSAGLMAAERSIDLLGAHDFNVLVLDLGSYKDPADAAKTDPNFMQNAAKTARKSMNFYFDRYLNSKLERKKKVRAILTKIKKLWSPVERGEWIRELSHKMHISEADLREEMDKVDVHGETPASQTKKEESANSRKTLLSERILSLVAADSSLRDLIDQRQLEILPDDYSSALKIMAGGDSLQSAREEVRDIINFVSLSGSLNDGVIEPQYYAEELANALNELEIEHLKEKQSKIKKEISTVEKEGREDLLLAKLHEFDGISKKMQDLKKKKAPRK